MFWINLSEEDETSGKDDSEKTKSELPSLDKSKPREQKTKRPCGYKKDNNDSDDDGDGSELDVEDVREQQKIDPVVLENLIATTTSSSNGKLVISKVTSIDDP